MKGKLNNADYNPLKRNYLLVGALDGVNDMKERGGV